jgi:hypothetical protein
MFFSATIFHFLQKIWTFKLKRNAFYLIIWNTMCLFIDVHCFLFFAHQTCLYPLFLRHFVGPETMHGQYYFALNENRMTLWWNWLYLSSKSFSSLYAFFYDWFFHG